MFLLYKWWLKRSDWGYNGIIKIKHIFEEKEFKTIENKNFFDGVYWVYFTPPNAYAKLLKNLKILKE